MSDPIRLLDCQNERPYEPVDPDADRIGYWHDEYGEPHPRARRWHPVRAFALALLEAGLLWGVVFVIIAMFYAVFG